MKNNIFTFLLFLSCSISIFGQNLPSLLIDNVSTQFSNVSLPYWLKAGQTINIGTNSKSVSILEFTVNGNSLEFSQAISLTSSQTVPSSKVWKVEGIGLTSQDISIVNIIANGNQLNSGLPSIYQSPVVFNQAGTFNWIVPPGVKNICVEAWGGGGRGGDGGSSALVGGGGGGSYGYECFYVTPGTSYTIIVGNGQGGSSSMGNLITANGGTNGQNASTGALSAGLGGTCSANYNISGSNGISSSSSCSPPAAKGGNGANGGIGGNGTYNTCVNGGGTTYNQEGGFPGGGGGGGQGSGTLSYGKNGGNGQIKIYF